MFKQYPKFEPIKSGYYNVLWSDGTESRNLWAYGWHPLKEQVMCINNREVTKERIVVGFREEE